MSDYGRARIVAGILCDLLAANPVRTVSRADILAAWYALRPQDDKQLRQGEEAHERLRRRTYLGERETHRGYSLGRRGTRYCNSALRVLEQVGVLRREESSVYVLDVPRLVQIRDNGFDWRGRADG